MAPQPEHTWSHTDEWGTSEWRAVYRRLSVGDQLAASEVEENSPNRMQALIKVWEACIDTLECDGSPVPILGAPLDVLVEAQAHHPLFRSSPDEQGKEAA